ncbi:ABC-type molybdate transport system substrate-binding protein [Sporomusaceae bacterium BoRhaA]|nr:ABC-type molybdate transport system substrate-binding protein [Pelorhabdus rhamnosifermentans]
MAATSDNVTSVATAPPDSHTPIIFPGVILKNSRQPEAVQEFLNYLTSSAGMKVFQQYGFQIAP